MTLLSSDQVDCWRTSLQQYKATHLSLLYMIQEIAEEAWCCIHGTSSVVRASQMGFERFANNGVNFDCNELRAVCHNIHLVTKPVAMIEWMWLVQHFPSRGDTTSLSSLSLPLTHTRDKQFNIKLEFHIMTWFVKQLQIAWRMTA